MYFLPEQWSLQSPKFPSLNEGFMPIDYFNVLPICGWKQITCAELTVPSLNIKKRNMSYGSAGKQKVLINRTNGDANEVSDYPHARICQWGSSARCAYRPDLGIPTVALQNLFPPNLHKSFPGAISSRAIIPMSSTPTAHRPSLWQALIQVSRLQPTSLAPPPYQCGLSWAGRYILCGCRGLGLAGRMPAGAVKTTKAEVFVIRTHATGEEQTPNLSFEQL